MSAVSRRDFLLGLGAGTIGAGIPLAWVTTQGRPQVAPLPSVAEIPSAMPGPFRGRVVEVTHRDAVTPGWGVRREAVRKMIDSGMCSLTGADMPFDAWKRLFAKDDIIGIKVNPVGVGSGSAIGAISHQEIVLEIVRNLKEIGVPVRNILLFERYAAEFVSAGYEKLLRERELEGVRWFAAADAYSGGQVEINGVSNPGSFSPELYQHIVGYDPDVFVSMGFSSPDHDPKDDRRFRSHLSTVVSRMVNKIITIPVLKDHRSAGVTLSLKNMSHGFNNNVARSHISGIAHGHEDSAARDTTGPNQCNTFIPTAVNQKLICQKATLHILDGLVGVFEGGPGVWNRSWGVWQANRLFFATDPVALDHIGWDVIDAKRLRQGLPRVGVMGKHLFTEERRLRMLTSSFAGMHPLEVAAMQAAENFVRGAGASEVFDRRQPEHIYLAGSIGLGEFDLAKIRHEKIRLM